MSQLFIILSQIGIFIILIAVGVFARRINILTESSLNCISQLTIKIALPCFIFINTAVGTTKEQLLGALPVFPITIAIYVVLISLSLLLEKIFRLKGNQAHIFRLCLVYGNVGLVGIPLATELYPETAMIYISVLTIVDQAMVWTYGVTLSYGVERKQKINLKLLKNMLVSPQLLAIVLAVVFVFLGLQLPDFINTAITKIGSLLMPLGLIYMGAMMSFKDVIDMLKRKEIYAEIICKMIGIPVLFYIVLSAIGLPQDMCGTMSIITGLPPLMICVMLAKNNGSDPKYAIGMMLSSTLACLVTYPVTSLILAVI